MLAVAAGMAAAGSPSAGPPNHPAPGHPQAQVHNQAIPLNSNRHSNTLAHHHQHPPIKARTTHNTIVRINSNDSERKPGPQGRGDTNSRCHVAPSQDLVSSNTVLQISVEDHQSIRTLKPLTTTTPRHSSTTYLVVDTPETHVKRHGVTDSTPVLGSPIAKSGIPVLAPHHSLVRTNGSVCGPGHPDPTATPAAPTPIPRNHIRSHSGLKAAPNGAVGVLKFQALAPAPHNDHGDGINGASSCDGNRASVYSVLSINQPALPCVSRQSSAGDDNNKVGCTPGIVQPGFLVHKNSAERGVASRCANGTPVAGATGTMTKLASPSGSVPGIKNVRKVKSSHGILVLLFTARAQVLSFVCLGLARRSKLL